MNEVVMGLRSVRFPVVSCNRSAAFQQPLSRKVQIAWFSFQAPSSCSRFPQFAFRDPLFWLDHIRKALFRPAEIPDAE